MTWAALVVSILALIVAGVALFFHFSAEARERRREQREADAAARAAEADRRAQVAEQRAQAAESREQARYRREEIEAQTTRMGRPSTDLLGTESGKGRAYRFRVTNIGKAAMRDLQPMLIANSGKVASEPFPQMYLKLLQSREHDEFVMTVTASVGPGPLFLRYEWGDDYGNREHVSGVEIPDT